MEKKGRKRGILKGVWGITSIFIEVKVGEEESLTTAEGVGAKLTGQSFVTLLS